MTSRWIGLLSAVSSDRTSANVSADVASFVTKFGATLDKMTDAKNKVTELEERIADADRRVAEADRTLLLLDLAEENLRKQNAVERIKTVLDPLSIHDRVSVLSDLIAEKEANELGLIGASSGASALSDIVVEAKRNTDSASHRLREIASADPKDETFERDGPWTEVAPRIGRSVWEGHLRQTKTVTDVTTVLHKHGFLGNMNLICTAFGRWYHNGLPRVTLGHRHAASLMCTTMSADLVRELHPPWDAFFLDVPQGILVYPGLGLVEHVCILTSDGGTVVALAMGHENLPGRDPFVRLSADSLAELCSDASDGGPAMQMLARYIVGAIAELMEYKPARYRERGAVAVRKNGRTGAPEIRTFELKRDIHVDCREAVKQFLAGSHTGHRVAPTVQRIVKGHWKRQSCGAKNADRKWIFVQPYWRGPEDAPIALRSHVVKVPERDTT